MNKQVINRRRKITEYVESQNHSPLYFRAFYGDKKLVDIEDYSDQDSLDDLVVKILKMSKTYCSVSKINFETTPGRYRSSLDIWRHVIAVRPDVDIFSVMESLLNVSQWLTYRYCFVVRRTVFSFASYTYENSRSPRSLVCREYDRILFSSWNKLS